MEGPPVRSGVASPKPRSVPVLRGLRWNDHGCRSADTSAPFARTTRHIHRRRHRRSRRPHTRATTAHGHACPPTAPQDPTTHAHPPMSPDRQHQMRHRHRCQFARRTTGIAVTTGPCADGLVGRRSPRSLRAPLAPLAALRAAPSSSPLSPKWTLRFRSRPARTGGASGSARCGAGASLTAGVSACIGIASASTVCTAPPPPTHCRSSPPHPASFNNAAATRPTRLVVRHWAVWLPEATVGQNRLSSAHRLPSDRRASQRRVKIWQLY